MADRRATSQHLPPIGRESEMEAISGLLAGPPGARVSAVVVAGPAGIGKTELWSAAIEASRVRGASVLEARPTEAEAQLPFAGLADLLDAIDIAAVDGLAAPQQRALETALLRVEPGEQPLEPHAVALGLLNTLRSMASRDAVVVAVDDAQWLDAASADALAFAARRLGSTTVRFIASMRSGTSSAVVHALESAGARRIDLAPLSFGAIRRLLMERLDIDPPRRVLRRLYEASRGNPLFALQLGRTISERGAPGIDEELEVPESVEALLDRRVSGLAPSLRRVLVAVGLDGQVRRDQLTAVTSAADVDAALAAGIIVVDGPRIRASHPLLSAAARTRADPAERRNVHRVLAGVVDDATLRARHLALATDLPDPDVAAAAESAAQQLRARGAVEDAAELAEHAVRLTSSDQPEYADRLLRLAEYLIPADPPRAVALLAAHLDELPRGSARARAHLLLADGEARNTDEIAAHIDQAMAEEATDPATRAMVLATRAMFLSIAVVAQVDVAEQLALDAIESAAGDATGERRGLRALAWARALSGKPIADVIARFPAFRDAPPLIYYALERPAALQRAYRGDVEGARRLLLELLELAEERGEVLSTGTVRIHIAEVALRAGDWSAAGDQMAAFRDSPDAELFIMPSHPRCMALLAAGRGDADEVERRFADVEAGYAASGVRWDLLEALRARGMAALLRGDPARAVDSLSIVWGHTTREGIDDPGAFPVAPDLVEALLETGQREAAISVADHLERLARTQEHPWGILTATRCRALIDLTAQPDVEDAAERLRETAEALGGLGLPFDRARTLLALGRAQRRRRKWASAREALESAAAAFETLDSPGWAQLCRDSLARVASRKPAAFGELTPAERRVVELAVEGRSNKEIAASVFVAVNTVEVHLSRAYAKLGVRSRAQLTQRFGTGAATGPVG